MMFWLLKGSIQKKKSKRSKLRCKISDVKRMSHYKMRSLTRFIVESLLKRALEFVRLQPGLEREKVNEYGNAV